MSNTLTVFLDNVGRTIIGKLVDQTDSTIGIENPALVHINTNQQTNQLQLQLLPLFFKEFLANGSVPTVWNFNKNTITLASSMELAPQFIGQYSQVFQAPRPAPVEEPRVIKLFDDE